MDRYREREQVGRANILAENQMNESEKKVGRKKETHII